MESLVFKLLNWTWCLPQTLCGFCWSIAVRGLLDRQAEEMGLRRDVHVIRYNRLRGGVSLGPYLFYQAVSGSHHLVRHEYGHYRQSLLLGPLYLPLIGLPSICWAAMKKAALFPAYPYLLFPTERWAERLAKQPPRHQPELEN
ncbi:MAG: hypothetical protein AB2588_02360 [Candidatus Thiodiazotropha sp.]